MHTLKELMEMQADFDKGHCGRIAFYEKISPENVEALEHLIVCVVGELGELSNIVKKVKRGDFEFDEKREDIQEELVDVFIYLVKMANQLDIDLEDAFFQKLEKNKKRFKRFEVPE